MAFDYEYKRCWNFYNSTVKRYGAEIWPGRQEPRAPNYPSSCQKNPSNCINWPFLVKELSSLFVEQNVV